MKTILDGLRKHWLSLTLFILTIIIILSLWPLESLPPVPGTDKTHHFVAYGTLMLPTALRKPKHWQIIVLLFIVGSGLIELCQPYVNRYGEFADLIANALGLGCGLILAEVILRIYPINLDRK